MRRPQQFFKRHTVLVGAFAVFVPLILLLQLQYGWLVRLEETTAIATTAYLHKYLEAVATEVEYIYKTSAERALNIPSSLFTKGRMEKVAYHFRKKEVEGARRLFVVDYVGTKEGKLYTYDTVERNMDTHPSSAEVKAIQVALAPWKMLASKGGKVDSIALSVDERDPHNRMILNPIIDDDWRVVGVAGMIVDNRHFRRELLPGLIEKSMSSFFHTEERELILGVRDGRGNLIHSTDEMEEQDSHLVRGFEFIFTDWTLDLHTRSVTPEQWARRNFAFNLALSALLAVVVIGGVILALRTVSREMRLSQMKAEFVSNVSHELRTPLSSIRVFAEFLRLGRVDADQKVLEYGEYIETESRRLTQLINNILDFSKIESGGKTYQFEAGDVARIVKETLRTFEVRLRHQGFHINFRQPDKPLPAVRMDATAIGQAVCNILDNAVKYSDGAKEIRVKLGRGRKMVRIAVTDQGMGIAGDEQGKIFERFHRVGTGLVHDVKGSGLGLAIVNHIVHAHGGKVTVNSELGRGSTFTIHLPVTEDGFSGVTGEQLTTDPNLGVQSHA